MAWLTSAAYHGMPDGSYVGTSPKRNVDVAALVYCKPETVSVFHACPALVLYYVPR